ncbi:unnamed protein product [Ciceribacter sp. T2.26MG-112.2]|uniref:hypothetical protein n=1 Tax=Ciceribacter sp. T2.26MG-112.2 TaxID=3137154 RepID=UPI000E185C36|nr:hypothetical protein [Ciceribacter naphthalenivorans]SSC73060.1 unnamed protein product [Ciceribacter naphthalenivorans]
MKQLDLFTWADNKPSNVIDARWRFEAKVIALVEGMISGRMPPKRDGQLIASPIKRRENPGEAA